MSILRVKDTSVNLISLVPQMVLAIQICHSILSQEKGNKDTVITSANDGKHSFASLHYSGCAVDLRSNWYDNSDTKLTDKMKNALGNDFDIILENFDTPNEHWHIEWQPKRRL